METEMSPRGVALYTRAAEDKSRDQFRWIGEVRLTNVAEQLKQLHRDFLVDYEPVDDEAEQAAFVLVDLVEGIGLLVANLKTSRRILIPPTPIDDTLLLEFESVDRKNALHLAAELLRDPSVVKQRLADYAEHRFEQCAQQMTVEPFKVSLLPHLDDEENPDLASRVALRANQKNKRRVSSLLYRAANETQSAERPFFLVSTGCLGLEKIRKRSEHLKSVIVLSQIRSLDEDQAVPLESERTINQPTPTRWWAKYLVTAGVSSLMGVFLLNRGQPDGTSPTNNNTPGGVEPFVPMPGDRELELVKVTGAIGMGANPDGYGPIRVMASLFAHDLRKNDEKP